MSASLTGPRVGAAEEAVVQWAPAPCILLLRGLASVVAVRAVVASAEGVVVALAFEGGDKVPEGRELIGVSQVCHVVVWLDLEVELSKRLVIRKKIDVKSQL